MPSLHIHAPPVFQMELEKTTANRWTCFGVRVPRTLDYATINKCAVTCTVRPHCIPVSDRQTDVNIVTIARRFVLTNASHA